MDVLLIISCIIISVLLFVVNFYILVIYSHPDDRGWGVSLFCRILVIVGLTLSWAQVLMLPLDVSNTMFNFCSNFFYIFSILGELVEVWIWIISGLQYI